jgi:hypothetical protein
MSGIGIALAVAGWVLFGVTLLAFVGLVAAGLGLTEHMDAVADGDLPSKGFDFDRDRSVLGGCDCWGDITALRQSSTLAPLSSASIEGRCSSTRRRRWRSGMRLSRLKR